MLGVVDLMPSGNAVNFTNIFYDLSLLEAITNSRNIHMFPSMAQDLNFNSDGLTISEEDDVRWTLPLDRI